MGRDGGGTGEGSVRNDTTMGGWWSCQACRRGEGECTCWRLCTCELVDISQPDEFRFTRGKSNGCRIHESESDRQVRKAEEASRAERRALRAAAERRAREA